MKHVKSPLGQTGHKYKLLDQLLPHFPEMRTFTEPFVGSGNVAVNINVEEIVINDSCRPIMEWLREVHEAPIDRILWRLDSAIKYFSLSSSNKDGYYALRDAYNETPNSTWFYLLNSHSFSNGIRFALDNTFNLPFGNRTFNPTRRKNMINFVKEWQRKDISFHSGDFEKIDYEGFAYFDPPYLGSIATYNTGWVQADDERLFKRLDKLDGQGIKWALSNVLANNGFINHGLSYWSQNYRTIPIDSSYRGSNYQRKNNGRTREVLIVNY